MLKKAYRYDDATLFYFDAHDNKYIASGGTLAWRLHNPGFLLSRSLHRTGYKSIGAYHQYAIFSHPLVGKEACRAWFCRSQYYDHPLIEIAKYYQRDNPVEYLDRLCRVTGLSSGTKPRSLRSDEFEKLLNAIQTLAGFTPDKEYQFSMLPKITARFYSKSRNVESYLAGYEHLLSKSEAIEWVESHKLDAVVVHTSKGKVYLRSRPGHHFNQIRFKQKEYGKEKDFKDAVREVGEVREGQCIWGFINGLSNTSKQALKSATLISKHAGNENIIYLINDADYLGNLPHAVAQKKGIHTKTVKLGAQYFRMLIAISNNRSYQDELPIVVFTHSQGALIANLALSRLEPEERQRIRIFTIGGAAFIAPDLAHTESHNYFSIADFVPRMTTYDFCMFLLRLYHGKRIGLTTEQVVEQLIQEDQDLHLTTQAPDVIAKFWEERHLHYEQEVKKAQNITLLDQNISAAWEHTLAIPCYLEVIKKIINRYRSC